MAEPGETELEDSRGPAPALPVFRPSAHTHEGKDVAPESTALREPLLSDATDDVESRGNKEDDSHDKDCKDKGEDASPTVLKQKKCICCLWIFLACSLLLNVVAITVAVFLYMLFTASSGEPVDPPTPIPTPSRNYNYSCSIDVDPSMTEPVLKVGANDTSSVDICWYFPQFGNDTENVQFTVMMDNWYKGIDTVTVPVVKSAPGISTLQIDNLLAAVPYQFQVTATAVTSDLDASDNNKTVLRSSPVMTVETSDLGACGNRADMLVYRNARDDSSLLQGQIRKCLISGLANKKFDVASCIENSAGLSSGCSACFASEKQCILSSCIGKCLPPTSKTCNRCLVRNCMGAVAQCGGLPAWFLDLQLDTVYDLDDAYSQIDDNATTTTTDGRNVRHSTTTNDDAAGALNHSSLNFHVDVDFQAEATNPQQLEALQQVSIAGDFTFDLFGYGPDSLGP